MVGETIRWVGRVLLVFPLICACSCSNASSQSSASGTSAAPIHMRDETFQLVTSVKGLPLGVREELQTMFGSRGLDIADPGADFDSSGKATPGLPARRLIAAGCANDGHCLVYYERGGAPLTHRVALLAWTPNQTKFEWGGTAPGGLKMIDDVWKAIVSGVIRGKQEGPW